MGERERKIAQQMKRGAESMLESGTVNNRLVGALREIGMGLERGEKEWKSLVGMVRFVCKLNGWSEEVINEEIEAGKSIIRMLNSD